MEIVVIFVLLLLNGLFAMSEIALVSSRKVRLQEMAKKKNKGAALALRLLEKPEKFLSTVQVGITLIGIVAGAYGGVALSEDLRPYIEQVPVLRPWSQQIALIIVVGAITYFSILIGELVPKTIAFNNPEAVSVRVAPLMWFLSFISKPIVSFLSISTKVLLKVMMIREKGENPVTEEELKLLLEQSTNSGILEARETEMIKNIFRFGDRRAYSIMTNRQDVIWIDISESFENIKNIILENSFSVYPVCEDSFDNIKGIFAVKDFVRMPAGEKFDIKQIITQPLFIPDNLPAIKVVERFRSAKVYTAIVVNEYGSTEGMITLHNLIESIFGDLPEGLEEDDGQPVFRRTDGTILIDGSLPVDELREIVDLPFDQHEYTTLGGFMMFKLKKIPSVGDLFEEAGYKFEIIDMDGKRVDKVLVTIKPGEESAEF